MSRGRTVGYDRMLPTRREDGAWTMRSVARHRVLLVREWDQQASGSGCCGRLNSATVEALSTDAVTPYSHVRVDMEKVGEIYRALRHRFSDTEFDITVVDPRNAVWLLPAVWRDARRRGLPVASALQQLSRANAPCTLICDGLVLGRDTTPQEAVSMMAADLSARRAG